MPGRPSDLAVGREPQDGFHGRLPGDLKVAHHEISRRGTVVESQCRRDCAVLLDHVVTCAPVEPQDEQREHVLHRLREHLRHPPVAGRVGDDPVELEVVGKVPGVALALAGLVTRTKLIQAIEIVVADAARSLLSRTCLDEKAELDGLDISLHEERAYAE